MSSSTSQATPTNPLFAQSVAEKLTKTNHAMWKAQIRAAIRSARLEGFLTGLAKAPNAVIITKEEEKPNPVYKEWEATDQKVLSYLLSSLFKEILAQAAAYETAAEAWKHIETLFSSQSHVRTVNLRVALSTTKKGSNEMAAAGSPLNDEELIEYVLTGLDKEYNPVVSAIVARAEPASIAEVYSPRATVRQATRRIGQVLQQRSHVELV